MLTCTKFQNDWMKTDENRILDVSRSKLRMCVRKTECAKNQQKLTSWVLRFNLWKFVMLSIDMIYDNVVSFEIEIEFWKLKSNDECAWKKRRFVCVLKKCKIETFSNSCHSTNLIIQLVNLLSPDQSIWFVIMCKVCEIVFEKMKMLDQCEFDKKKKCFWKKLDFSHSMHQCHYTNFIYINVQLRISQQYMCNA